MRTPRIFAAIFSTALVTALFAQSSKPNMRAIVMHEYGGPDVLKYEQVPRPEPKDDQILVRVIADGVNPGDAMLRSGIFGKSEKDVPKILGADIAGEVGSKITKFKAGDPVFHATLQGGGYAEYRLATERDTALKPKSLTYGSWKYDAQDQRLSQATTVINLPSPSS